MTNRVSLIAAYSHAFSRAECPDFIGIGGKYTTQNCELGIFSDMARFEEATEFATEITGKYQFTPNIYVQPSVPDHISPACSSCTLRVVVSTAGHQKKESSFGKKVPIEDSRGGRDKL